MKNVTLAYSIDNVRIAEDIERQLSRAPFTFEHFYCKRTSQEEPLSTQLRGRRGTILLIVSDNFLKSAQCMNNGLRLLQDRGNDILPVIVDGQSRDEQGGQLASVPTQFDRVSDIIKYINYWQDQYLDLRKQKRQVSDMDEESFNTHLRVMREISGEIGEFLRTLRTLPYLSYEDFSNNNFESFFRFVQEDAAWRNFRELPALAPTYASNNGNIPVAIAEPAFNLNDIPGMDLLQTREDAITITPQEQPTFEETPATNSNNTFEFVNESLDITPEPVVEEPVNTAHLGENGVEKTEPIDDAQIQRWIEETSNAASAGNAVEALTTVQNLTEKYPDNSTLRFHYAVMLAQYTDNLAEGVHQLETVLDREPNNEAALFLMGQLAELKGDFLLAKNSYERILETNAQNADAHYRLGMVTVAQFPEQSAQALNAFQKAAQYSPENTDALYRYASLLAEDEPEGAIEPFKQLLELEPEHPFANYDLALLYERLEQPEAAREHYLRAVKINPELKTEENDALFEYKIPVVATPTPPIAVAPVIATATPPHTDISIAVDTIEMLKQNIAQIELMLKQQEAKPAPEPESVQPRIGEGKTVLITGATSGIGRATAALLAENGFRLLLTGRREERLEEVETEFTAKYNTQVKTMNLDVRDVNAVNQMVNELPEDWQNIDILINNAGKAKGLAPIHEGNLEHWEEMIDTNLKGLLYVTRAVTPAMVQRGSGHIVNVGSVAGKEVYMNGNVYNATKFAVDALTRGMRLDLVKHNIRVSQVSPGHVEETEFSLVRFDGDAEKAEQVYTDFKPLNARDVADAILYILTCPPHVNVQDITLLSTQQASATVVNRSGREVFEQPA